MAEPADQAETLSLPPVYLTGPLNCQGCMSAAALQGLGKELS